MGQLSAMKSPIVAAGVLFVTGCCLVMGALGAPTTASPSDVPESQEAANQSNPEPCKVAGSEYSHGQQVPREDPCEFCLCLDGELFCWWQDCPPSSTGPCRASRAFSACANASSTAAANASDELSTSTSLTASPMSGVTEPTKATSAAANNNNNKKQVLPGTEVADQRPDVTSSDSVTSVATDPNTTPGSVTDAASLSSTTSGMPTPTTCYVMGTEYKVGEVLPRDTGTCLECVCDAEARVTCSPKDCASQHDDYRSGTSLDMFDVDTF